ncbi:hypothetical protein HPB50_011072 [Hyalomma asiaticum]|uniref:Uncharacterized protein n=1 Tax=Hyalomma asiaticum TaxID=266040 RepID=A0ACB7S6L5_HYAAI|nr:hypothetical protein HPB50_011072 [Hyalomma asiaticum]
MVLRLLLRYLLHNEQLIQRLADSYPFRRAAQLTAHVMLRGKAFGQESLELMSTSSLLRTLIERIGRTTEKAKDISSDKVKKLERALRASKALKRYIRAFLSGGDECRHWALFASSRVASVCVRVLASAPASAVFTGLP